MSYFDPLELSRQAGIAPEALSRINEMMRHDYGSDPMMAELQLIRVCLAIRDGWISLEEVLKSGPQHDPYTVRCICPKCNACEQT